MVDRIFNTDCLVGLKTLESNSVDCCVTSPPYYGLRDYGHAGQIGLEKSPEEFVSKLVTVFNEVRRVLKPTGTLWLNLGDTYAANPKGTHGSEQAKQRSNRGSIRRQMKNAPELKTKDLIGIPWMVAFALRSSGWYLRQDIIWHKPNPMPESVTDRCTKAHEYVFLLTKSPKYFFDADAIKTDAINPADDLRKYNQQKWGNKERKPGSDRGCPADSGSNVASSVPWEGLKANKRSVWSVPVRPYNEAHFATYPPELIIDCIKAGCPVGGLVLDPFMGAATTAVVAKKLNRNFVGFELNADYITIAEKRLYHEIGIFR